MNRLIRTIRHDALIPEILRTTPIHVVGVGGVGSHVVELLARMQLGQPGITIYDGDSVETHNPPSQQFTRNHVGMLKVEALAQQARVWSDDQVSFAVSPQMVEHKTAFSGIVFLCLDSMQARRTIFSQSLFSNPDVKLVIETRMDATLAEVFLVDPCNAIHEEFWKAYWFPDDKAENSVGCGGHYAIPTATSMTANLAVQQLINYFSEGGQDTTPNQLMLNLRTWKVTATLWPKEDLT